eukprot:gene16263-19298_t
MVAKIDGAVEAVHAARVVWTLEEDDIWNDCPEGERKPSARAPGVSLPAQSTVVAQEGPPKKPEGRRSVTGTWGEAAPKSKASPKTIVSLPLASDLRPGYARFLEGQWVVQQAGKQPEADWRNWVSRGAVPEEPSAPSMRYHSAPGGRRPEPDAAGRARRMAGCSLNRIPTQLAAAVRVGDVSPAWTKADKSATFKEKLPKVYKPQPPPRPGPSKEGSREQSQMISGSKRVPRSVAAAQAAALCVVQNPPLQPQ